MGRPGPRKVPCYSLEFKRTAVGLSRQPGMQVQVVAARAAPAAAEGHGRQRLRRLQALEVAHRVLQEEHALLKKAIRFCSARKATSSPSSKRNRTPGR